MTKRQCANCKWWAGDDTSARAACQHPQGMGRTAFDFVCSSWEGKPSQFHAPGLSQVSQEGYINILNQPKDQLTPKQKDQLDEFMRRLGGKLPPKPPGAKFEVIYPFPSGPQIGDKCFRYPEMKHYTWDGKDWAESNGP